MPVPDRKPQQYTACCFISRNSQWQVIIIPALSSAPLKNAPKLLTLFLVGSTFLWSQEQSTFGEFQLGRERHSDPKGWPAIARLKNFWKKKICSIGRAKKYVSKRSWSHLQGQFPLSQTYWERRFWPLENTQQMARRSPGFSRQGHSCAGLSLCHPGLVNGALHLHINSLAWLICIYWPGGLPNLGQRETSSSLFWEAGHTFLVALTVVQGHNSFPSDVEDGAEGDENRTQQLSTGSSSHLSPPSPYDHPGSFPAIPTGSWKTRKWGPLSPSLGVWTSPKAWPGWKSWHLSWDPCLLTDPPRSIMELHPNHPPCYSRECFIHSGERHISQTDMRKFYLLNSKLQL